MLASSESIHELVEEIKKDPKVRLAVPARLTDPDEHVIALKRTLTLRGTQDDYDYTYRNSGVLTSGGITVAPKNVSRALRVFDTLVKALKARGHLVNGPTVDVKGQQYVIRIRERLRRITGSYKKEPTGILCMQFGPSYATRELCDAKTVFIEDKIAQTIAYLEKDAAITVDIIEHNRQLQEERKKQEQLAREAHARKEKELQDFKSLLDRAERAEKAKLIRKFADDLESKAIIDGRLTEELTTYLSWARKKADWYDPHIEAEDELLNEVDKVTLKLADSEQGTRGYPWDISSLL